MRCVPRIKYNAPDVLKMLYRVYCVRLNVTVCSDFIINHNIMKKKALISKIYYALFEKCYSLGS